MARKGRSNAAGPKLRAHTPGVEEATARKPGSTASSPTNVYPPFDESSFAREEVPHPSASSPWPLRAPSGERCEGLGFSNGVHAADEPMRHELHGRSERFPVADIPSADQHEGSTREDMHWRRAPGPLVQGVDPDESGQSLVKNELRQKIQRADQMGQSRSPPFRGLVVLRVPREVGETVVEPLGPSAYKTSRDFCSFGRACKRELKSGRPIVLSSVMKTARSM